MIYARFKGVAKFWDLRNWNGFQYYEEIFPKTQFERFGITKFVFEYELRTALITNENGEIIKNCWKSYNTIQIGRNDVY